MMIKVLLSGVTLLSVSLVSEAGMFSDKMASAGSGGGPMSLLMSFMPPECKKEVNEIAKEADGVYDWIVKKKCAECPNGVQASPLMLKEAIAKKAIDSYIDWLAGEGMDIDKVCTAKFRRAEMWPFYDKLKPKCVMDTNEFTKIQNLCKATDKEFPKTSACVKGEAMEVFKKRATPPPMDCVSKALKKCNSKDLGKWKKHFLVEMKGDPNVHKGVNLWVIANDFFKNKCTGKP
jgi:hypothetical protein